MTEPLNNKGTRGTDDPLTKQQEAAARELLRRKRALRSIYHFMGFMRSTGLLAFQHKPAAHHKLIIQELESLEEAGRLMVNQPPGSAKSTYMSVIYPCWRLARNPSEKIICACHSESLAEEFSRDRRAIIQSKEWQILSGSSIDQDAKSLGAFRTIHGGSIVSVGVGSGVTGLRANIIISDDLVRGAEQADSPSQLSKINRWYHTDLRTRLVPGGQEIICMTRWAQLDIAGVMKKRAEKGEEQWRQVILPMLANSPNDPLKRPLNAPLWPEWYREQDIQEAMREPRTWSCLYQQSPLNDEGAWVPDDKIRYVTEVPEHLTIMAGIDLALSVNKGDFTVIAIGAIDNARNFYLLHLWRSQVAVNDTIEKLFELVDHYQPLLCIIDNDNPSKVFADLCREKGITRNKTIPLSFEKIGGRDKQVRASPLRGLFLNDRVFIKRGPWNASFHQEVMEFPGGAHDDMVDAVALCAKRLSKTVGPSGPDAPPEIEPVCFIQQTDAGLRTTVGLEKLWEQMPAQNERI